MLGYVADRPRRSRPDRASRMRDFMEAVNLEWAAPTPHYDDTHSIFFTGCGEGDDEFTDIGGSVRSYAGESIGRLRRLYEFRNEVEVEDFLEEKPFLIRLLFEAYERIREYFDTNSPLVLVVVADPEVQEERELFLFIQTRLGPRAARTLLDELDRVWWMDAMLDAKGEMTISLEYV